MVRERVVVSWCGNDVGGGSVGDGGSYYNIIVIEVTPRNSFDLNCSTSAHVLTSSIRKRPSSSIP